MAQQTQMSRVMPSYERFVAAFPTLELLAAASLGDVIRVWQGMGYNQRAVRLHRAARQIAAEGWPRDAASLTNIDGIGPFTAAIIASFALNADAACVDTNVRRVLGRIAGVDGIDGAPLQRLADEWLARGEAAHWNQAVMDYGARICVPRPKCAECVVSSCCVTFARGAAPAPVASAAEERATYDPRPPRKPRTPQPKFETTDRYFRGRIIDLLRTLPPGERVRLADLPSRLPAPADALAPERATALVDALIRHGLAELRDGTLALPE
jgi:A/G-specific adenine glycosylase